MSLSIFRTTGQRQLHAAEFAVSHFCICAQNTRIATAFQTRLPLLRSCRAVLPRHFTTQKVSPSFEIRRFLKSMSVLSERDLVSPLKRGRRISDSSLKDKNTLKAVQTLASQGVLRVSDSKYQVSGEGKRILNELDEFSFTRNDALSFVSSGEACFAFYLLQELGLICLISNRQNIFEGIPKQYKLLPIRHVLILLEQHKILVKISDGIYQWTSFGEDLVKQRGVIGLMYGGYRMLFAHQTEIVKSLREINSLVNGKAVAEASKYFGVESVDPIFKREIQNLIEEQNLTGTICDLGCGTADRLIEICEFTGLKRFGVERDEEAIKLAKDNTKDNPNVMVEQSDLTKLDKSWPDVELLMQWYVMHDLSTEEFKKTVKSFLSLFPQMKYFVCVDCVISTNPQEKFLPGFAIIHALLGIETRTLQQTTDLFSETYEVCKVISTQTPNVYIWILKPKRDSQ